MRNEGLYELDWYFETKADADSKQGAFDAIYNRNATAEQIESTVSTFTTFLQRCDRRWGDGRMHVTGRDVTAADFNLLAFHTSIVVNRGLYNPEVNEQLKAELGKLANV